MARQMNQSAGTGSNQILTSPTLAGVPKATAPLCEQFTTATIGTAGDVTYTAAQFCGGVIRRDPNGADRVDASPTAAAVIAERGMAVGDAFYFTLINENDAGGEEEIEIDPGTGVTALGSATSTAKGAARFRVECTGAAAIEIARVI